MIQFIVVHSPFEASDLVSDRLKAEIEFLQKFPSIVYTGNVSSANEAGNIIRNYSGKPGGIIIFVATGGTENYIKTISDSVDYPILLVANSQKNSFAAALESFAFLKTNHAIDLLYSDDSTELAERINQFIIVCNAIYKINHATVGIIGEPSDWLLTSKDYKNFGKFGTTLKNFAITELTDKIENADKHDSDKTASQIKETYKTSSVPEQAVLDSAKVYTASKELIEENNLASITIKCFDLLQNNYTACMAMSLLNDEGIISGCEGDLEATFSMMLGYYITNSPCWMANPAHIDKQKNTLTLAHCTIASKMFSDLSQAELTTHMESGLSVANMGPLRLSDVTIFRMGSSLSVLTAITGKIVETNMKNELHCRTQAKIKLDGPIDKWTKNTPGNHQVIVYGDIKNELELFCKFSGVEFNYII
ncbi:MAG: hypothetical protein CVV23_01680 [Ignavibacteriae bacterium HGW-Ignavibacteriae-2]|jgi:L-fucose isomerase-like protein|nr:MAG: hypothetical protein CVV23_01680 [Ignavibacteriae bacterium HGW-Ignavibacteriae-2]